MRVIVRKRHPRRCCGAYKGLRPWKTAVDCLRTSYYRLARGGRPTTRGHGRKLVQHQNHQTSHGRGAMSWSREPMSELVTEVRACLPREERIDVFPEIGAEIVAYS